METSWDSTPSRLLPFSILREGNLDLDEFRWLYRHPKPPYFVRRTADNHWMSAYPIATPLLGTPIAIPAVLWLRHRGIQDEDVRFRVVAAITERVTAALIVAASTAVLFLALLRLTPVRSAVILSLVYAFGTNTWATSSQAMWQHGLAELSLASVSFFLLGEDTRRNAMGASAFAALGVMARPTMVVFALLALVFAWRRRRGNLPAFLLLPVVGAIALLAYNVQFLGGLAGGYAAMPLLLPSPQRLAGLLVSPNRGLLIYTPFAALAAWGMWRGSPRRWPWLRYLGAGMLGYLLLYSSYDGWYGGEVYGPRLLVDMMPAVVLCAAPVSGELLSARWGRTTFLVLALWSVSVQVIGVYFNDNGWNRSPRLVDDRRVWDWRDPQIVRAALSGWHGSNLAQVFWQTFTDPRPVILRPLEPADLVGEITLIGEPPRRVRRDGTARVRFRLTNRSGVAWPAFGDAGFLQCMVGYRWLKDGRVLRESGGISLPRNLGAGESVEIRGSVTPPEETGSLELELTLVQLVDQASGIFGGLSRRIPVHVE